MNKKFLSAILFGALMVTSTGTFVSCKDYDDDIDRIDQELSSLSSKLEALQTQFNAGKYVTNVATTADGLTITLNDGTSYNVTNGKDGAQGEKGQDGDKVEINEEGYFVINGEVQEWKAVTTDELGQTVKVKVPTVSEDGCWVFYDEKGEAHATTIKVAPVTAVENADKSWTLTVYDANGGSKEITVPTAASSLTDLMLITRNNRTFTEDMPEEFGIHQYDFSYDKNGYTSSAPDREKWAGQRTLPEAGYILAGTSSLKIQVNPTKVDAADLDLKLVDSKNNYINMDFETSPSTGIEYFSRPTTTRAANANGLYRLSVADKYIKKSNANTELNNYWAQFETKVNNATVDKAYAVTAGGDVRSKYEVKVNKVTTVEPFKYIYMENGDTYDWLTFANGVEDEEDYYLAKNAKSTGSDEKADAKLEPNVWYYVGTDKSYTLYDMHLVYSDDDETLFGIETLEENGDVYIRLTATPDKITKAAFKLTIQTVDKTGKYNEAIVWLGETSTITDAVVYDPITHQLSKNNSSDTSQDKNFFQIDLTKMKNALGTQGLALWNNKVKSASVTYYKADGTKLAESSEIDEFFVSELKSNLKDNKAKNVTVGKSATNMIFEVANTAAAAKFDIDKQYTAVISFLDGSNEVLNTIEVPFTFTLPAITTLFQIDPGFVKDGVANCYLYADDFTAAKTAGAATFKLSRIFSKYDANGFTVKLNTTDKIGTTDKKSSELAGLNVVAATTTTDATLAATAIVTDKILAYLTLSGDLGKEAGYDQVLKLTIDGKFDNAWTYPSDAVFNFQVKVMSPIEKGKVVPKEGNVVKIKASDLNGYKFGNDVIIGYTYNSEVTYKVMPDLAADENDWTRNDIKEVAGKSGNTLYFDVTEGGDLTKVAEWGTPTNATEDTVDNKKVTTEGALVLKGYQVDHTVDTTITIKVTDIWKRAKESDVPVQITVGE